MCGESAQGGGREGDGVSGLKWATPLVRCGLSGSECVGEVWRHTLWHTTGGTQRGGTQRGGTQMHASDCVYMTV